MQYPVHIHTYLLYRIDGLWLGLTGWGLGLWPRPLTVHSLTDTMPQPLPNDLPHHLDHSEIIEGIRKAYSTLLKIQEATSSADIGSKKSLEQKLMHVRIIGYLIREGPPLTASEFIAEEVKLI